MVWKQALAFRTDGSVPPGAAGGGPTARTATRASVDAAAERTVERLQAVVEGSRERGASAAAGSATRPGSAFFQRWCGWLCCGFGCGSSCYCCPRWCCSWCERAAPGPADDTTPTGGSQAAAAGVVAGVGATGGSEFRLRCVSADEEFARKLVLRGAPQSLADLAVVLVAKLRPGGEAAAMLRAKPAEQRAGGLAARLGGASPAEALRLLGVVRIVSQTDSVELVDDADAADLRSGDTLTVHWASPGELPAAERAGGRHEGASGGVEAAASAGPPAGVDGLRRRAKQSHA